MNETYASRPVKLTFGVQREGRCLGKLDEPIFDWPCTEAATLCSLFAGFGRYWLDWQILAHNQAMFALDWQDNDTNSSYVDLEQLADAQNLCHGHELDCGSCLLGPMSLFYSLPRVRIITPHTAQVSHPNEPIIATMSMLIELFCCQ